MVVGRSLPKWILLVDVAERVIQLVVVELSLAVMFQITIDHPNELLASLGCLQNFTIILVVQGIVSDLGFYLSRNVSRVTLLQFLIDMPESFHLYNTCPIPMLFLL